MNHRKPFFYYLMLSGMLSFFAIKGSCQNFNTNVSNISVRNGLSQNTIQDIHQDHLGFLWIATQDGLNKYDGYTFKVYKSNPDDPASIPNNFAKCIQEDMSGNLWIGTQTGLAKYIYRKDVFQFIPTLSGDVINAVLIDDESIFIGTDNGIEKAEGLQTPKFAIIDTSRFSQSVNFLEKDHNGRIWIASENGLSFLSPATGQIQAIDFFNGVAINLLFYKNEKLWIASNRGLFSMDPDQKSIEILRQKPIYYKMNEQAYKALSVFEDHMQTIWVGTESNGLYMVDKATYSLQESNLKSDAFKYSLINEIYEDYTHCLWVGTIEAGLFKVNISNQNFRLIRNEKGDPDGLSSNIIRGLYKVDHRLWIGSSRGLNLFDRDKGTGRQFVFDRNDTTSLSSNDVKVMTYSRDGALWVGTNDGLNRLDPGTQNFSRFYAEDPNPLIPDNKIRSIKFLSDGNIWIATLGGGISVIDPINKRSIRMYTTINSGIGEDNVMNIYETKKKEIYAASYGKGLFKLNKKEDIFERILPNEALPELLTSVHESDDGLLWVGTYGDGFYSYNPNTSEYIKFTTEDGLSNNVAYAVIPYDSALWISTNLGLNKFDRKSGTFLTFNENDGIQSNEFNTNSFFKCHTGELFFGGVNGLTYFHPDSIQYDVKIPKLAFTEFKIFNQSIRPDQVVIRGDPPLKEVLSDSTSVRLAHFHNSFSIEFAALDYGNPNDSKYAYMLDGFDEDWVYTNSDKRNVTYTNLDPGSYNFVMKASNGDGVWNDKPLALLIDVKPSVWQTAWFRIIALVSVASILVTLVYQRINKVERTKKYLEGRVDQHTKEISAQNKLLLESEQHLINENKKKDQVFYILSHNVRAPLTTLVALMRNSEQLPKEDFEKFISDSSQQVSESLLLLDNAFYWSLIQFDKLDTHIEVLDLSSLINENIQKFKKTSQKRDITVEYEEQKIDFASDRRMLSLIIQNLLFNSIKFSEPNNNIRVSLEKGKEIIKFIISYSGKGLNKHEINELFDEVTDIHKMKSQSEKGVALGLIVSYKLAKNLDFEIDFEKSVRQSTLILEMPFR